MLVLEETDIGIEIKWLIKTQFLVSFFPFSLMNNLFIEILKSKDVEGKMKDMEIDVLLLNYQSFSTSSAFQDDSDNFLNRYFCDYFKKICQKKAVKQKSSIIQGMIVPFMIQYLESYGGFAFSSK